MLSDIIQLMIGLGIILWAAELLMVGAIGLANHWNCSHIVIGMTVLGIGSSLPEMVMVLTAAAKGYQDIAVGNILGSNIVHILLILGIAGLLSPFTVPIRVYQRELFWLLGVTLLLGWPLSHHYLQRLDGWILTGLGLLFVGYSVWYPTKQATVGESSMTQSAPAVSMWRMLGMVGLGLILLPISAQWVVNPAITLANYWGISELAIGITVMSLGSSLPELVIVLVGIHKRQSAVVIGNVIGSNLFNSIVVMAMAAGITPGPLNPQAFFRDYWVMLGATLLLLLFCYQSRLGLQRLIAVLMLGSFAGYLRLLAS